ncbi:hypothetical protein ACJX0J_032888, partial [Zea mays]
QKYLIHGFSIYNKAHMNNCLNLRDNHKQASLYFIPFKMEGIKSLWAYKKLNFIALLIVWDLYILHIVSSVFFVTTALGYRVHPHPGNPERKFAANNPLYLQSFTEADDALKLHHIVHCSLDVIDERVSNPKRSAPTLNETFLGLLYPTENYKVYGYLTNTKVKFIMVTTDLDVKDADARN